MEKQDYEQMTHQEIIDIITSGFSAKLQEHSNNVLAIINEFKKEQQKHNTEVMQTLQLILKKLDK